MEASAHVFLGSNSTEGFYSLYGQLLNARFDDLLIIKGGPGCGKSSFMRRVAERLPQELDRIYVNCSGDPESLDGVFFPTIGAGLVDGTAPHALEPTYTAAHERYLDLTRFYDLEAARGAREEIVSNTKAYRAEYASAYRVLHALGGLSGERRAVVHAAMDFEKLERRVSGILRRELRGTDGGPGRVDRAFLGGTTHLGELCRFDTAEALCPRIYVFEDSFGLASEQLKQLCVAASEAGCDVLACPNPDRPEELQHVLVPARDVAFVTSTAHLPYRGAPYRRLRVDAMAETALPRKERARLRFTGRLERELRSEAVEALRRAKGFHDRLEAAYNPCVDFDGVYGLAEREAERLVARMNIANC